MQTGCRLASCGSQGFIEQDFCPMLLFAVEQIAARNRDFQHFFETHGLSTQLHAITVVGFRFAAFVFDGRDRPEMKGRIGSVSFDPTQRGGCRDRNADVASLLGRAKLVAALPLGHGMGMRLYIQAVRSEMCTVLKCSAPEYYSQGGDALSRRYKFEF